MLFRVLAVRDGKDVCEALSDGDRWDIPLSFSAGNCQAVYAASVHSRPFPGFPTKPGCDSFLSPSSDLFSHGWEMDSHR